MYPAGTKLRPVLDGPNGDVVMPPPDSSSNPRTVLVFSATTGYSLILVLNYELAGHGRLDANELRLGRAITINRSGLKFTAMRSDEMKPDEMAAMPALSFGRLKLMERLACQSNCSEWEILRQGTTLQALENGYLSGGGGIAGLLPREARRWPLRRDVS
jgi:hypothetical protein